MTRGQAALNTLARHHGVALAYRDAFHHRRTASPDTLLGVLRALGIPLARVGDAPDQLWALASGAAIRPLEPVVLAHNGSLRGITLRLPEAVRRASQACAVTLHLEDGSRRRWTVRLDRLPARPHAVGRGLRTIRLPVTSRVPLGYHRLTVALPAETHDALVVAAPRRIDPHTLGAPRRGWGVYAPVYALRAPNRWGVGEWADLRALMDWTAATGGAVVATLPQLATFLDRPYEPSPYSPVSRLFWNELFLTLEEVPEFAASRRARQLAASTPVSRLRAALDARESIAYPQVMALKRRILEQLAETFFASAPPARRQAFARYLASHPRLEEYARFRAMAERQRRPWSAWPARARAGNLQDADVPAEALRYHLYAQWVSDGQLARLARHAGRRGVALYLDLPLGTHPQGYDTWRDREAFALDCAGGAPPDPGFPAGQHWGFPPLHPERIRAQGYAYYIAALRHHLQYAHMLRIDHVMSLHRLYWIPRGLPPSHGTYVEYRAEELYAILVLEAIRHRALIVGENLGTVPPEVEPAMRRHGIHRMFVTQFALTSGASGLPPVPRDCVASLNTHDLSPWAGFWAARDPAEPVARRLVAPGRAVRARAAHARMQQRLVARLRRTGWLPRQGSADAAETMAGCLRHLARSAARIVLLNLEDAWGETRPQNVPGSPGARNWRRRIGRTLQDIAADRPLGRWLVGLFPQRKEPWSHDTH